MDTPLASRRATALKNNNVTVLAVYSNLDTKRAMATVDLAGNIGTVSAYVHDEVLPSGTRSARVNVFGLGARLGQGAKTWSAVGTAWFDESTGFFKAVTQLNVNFQGRARLTPTVSLTGEFYDATLARACRRSGQPAAK
jgi:hypothetical protein